MDDGVFGKLIHTILSNRCLEKSGEYILEGFCVQKAGQPSIDLTCTRWKTHREAFS